MVVVDEQVLYTASNCQLLQESQIAAPGPEKSPFAHGLHTLAAAALNVPDKQDWHAGAAACDQVPASHVVHSEEKGPDE